MYTFKYINAFYSGYTAEIDNLLSERPEGSLSIKSLYPDVRLRTKKGYDDATALHKKALITVNGIIHRTTVKDDKFYIVNATRLMLKTGSNHIGIHLLRSFNDDLDIKHIRLTYNDIIKDEHHPLYKKIYIKLPYVIEQPLLVFLGYLVLPSEDTFYRVNDSTYCLEIDKLMYMQRLNELAGYMDIYKDLGIEVSPHNPTVVSVEDATSDETIMKTLLHNNTFIVDTRYSSITASRIYLERTTIPSLLRTSQNPSYGLIGGYGKFIEYIHERGYDGIYSLYTEDHVFDRYLMSKRNLQDIELYNAHREVGSTYHLIPGSFLKLEAE